MAVTGATTASPASQASAATSAGSSAASGTSAASATASGAQAASPGSTASGASFTGPNGAAARRLSETLATQPNAVRPKDFQQASLWALQQEHDGQHANAQAFEQSLPQDYQSAVQAFLDGHAGNDPGNAEVQQQAFYYNPSGPQYDHSTWGGAAAAVAGFEAGADGVAAGGAPTEQTLQQASLWALDQANKGSSNYEGFLGQLTANGPMGQGAADADRVRHFVDANRGRSSGDADVQAAATAAWRVTPQNQATATALQRAAAANRGGDAAASALASASRSAPPSTAAAASGSAAAPGARGGATGSSGASGAGSNAAGAGSSATGAGSSAAGAGSSGASGAGSNTAGAGSSGASNAGSNTAGASGSGASGAGSGDGDDPLGVFSAAAGATTSAASGAGGPASTGSAASTTSVRYTANAWGTSASKLAQATTSSPVSATEWQQAALWALDQKNDKTPAGQANFQAYLTALPAEQRGAVQSFADNHDTNATTDNNVKLDAFFMNPALPSFDSNQQGSAAASLLAHTLHAEGVHGDDRPTAKSLAGATLWATQTAAKDPANAQKFLAAVATRDPTDARILGNFAAANKDKAVSTDAAVQKAAEDLWTYSDTGFAGQGGGTVRAAADGQRHESEGSAWRTEAHGKDVTDPEFQKVVDTVSAVVGFVPLPGVGAAAGAVSRVASSAARAVGDGVAAASSGVANAASGAANAARSAAGSISRALQGNGLRNLPAVPDAQVDQLARQYNPNVQAAGWQQSYNSPADTYAQRFWSAAANMGEQIRSNPNLRFDSALTSLGEQRQQIAQDAGTPDWSQFGRPRATEGNRSYLRTPIVGRYQDLDGVQPLLKNLDSDSTGSYGGALSGHPGNPEDYQLAYYGINGVTDKGEQVPLTGYTGYPRQGGGTRWEWNHSAPDPRVTAQVAKAFDDAKAPLPSGQTEAQQLQTLNERVGKFHWWMAQACPFERGSAAVADMMTSSLYYAHGYAKPAWRPGVSADVSALTTPNEAAFSRSYGGLMSRPPERLPSS